MGSKVQLIYPPSRIVIREDRCQVSSRVIISPLLPPTDLMYLAAVAEAEGCLCKITDYTLDKKTFGDFAADIKDFRPDFLVISTTTPTLDDDLRICSAAKRILPDIRIIAKGAHFLKFSEKVMERFYDLDMIVRGEAEMTFKEVIQGKEPSEIEGLTWRGPEGVISNPDRQFIEDLDSLPFPARHLIDNSLYVRPDNNKPLGVIKVSRGCPYHCFFCLASPVSGTNVRMRSPENIIRELRLCIEKYGIRDFIFWSDIFSMSKQWVMELCRAIIDSGLKFTWSANTRADTIDIEMAEYMRKAGCVMVSVGVESGNQEILNKTGKGITIEQIRETFRIFKKAGLKTLAYYLIGLPWETRETAEETIRFSIELDSDFASFFTVTPLPGTRFFEYVLENGLFDTGVDIIQLYEDSYYCPTVKGHYLSKDEIAGLQKKAVRRFYLRPRYILKSLLRIHSWRELINYSKAALSIIRK